MLFIMLKKWKEKKEAEGEQKNNAVDEKDQTELEEIQAELKEIEEEPIEILEVDNTAVRESQINRLHELSTINY